MRKDDGRGQVLAAAAFGDGVVMAEPEADSTGTVATPPSAFGKAADFTSPNGDGHSEVDANSGTVTQTIADDPIEPGSAVVTYTGSGDTALVTGYIQSATDGRGVIRITSNQGFTYNGTDSELVSGSTATNADTLFIAANSVTMTTGMLTALGAGSTALDVTATGGTGSGGINVTVDGDILSSAGNGIVLEQNDDAATGNVILTSTIGNTITSGNGDAVTILTDGSGTITVDLADAVSATGGDGISVRDSVIGGDISVTTAAVSALSAAGDAIDVQSLSTTADVTIIADGAIDAGDDGVVAAIMDATATGNISVTTNSTLDAGNNGVDAVNSGTGSITVNAVGPITSDDDGITAITSGGGITVTAGNVTSTSEEGIDATQGDATGAGSISITANGDVSGLRGIRAQNLGTGATNVDANGSVTGTAGDAILVISNPTGGAIGVTTAAGEVLSANGGSGIDVDQAGAGNVGVINEAAVNSGAVVNTFDHGADVHVTGTGSVTINNSGAIGTAGDRAQLTGLNVAIINAASAGTISIAGTGAIFSVDDGINIETNGTGSASVVYGGAINTTAGDGIDVSTTSGSITITSGGAISAPGGDGIETLSTSGNQTITVNGAVNGGGAFDGVHAVSTSGTLTVNVNGANVTGADDAVDVSSGGAKTVTITAGRTLTGGDLGIASTGTGATTINNSGTVTGTGVAIRSETSATTLNNLAGATINGAISLSGLNDSVTNAGTIAGTLSMGAGDDLYDGVNGSISGTINGGTGNDTMLVGAGAQSMAGGAGNDTFRGTATGLNGDTISDFAAGDKIVISDADLASFSFSLDGNTLTYTGGSLTLTGFSGQLQASAAAGGGVQLTVGAPPVIDARNDFNGDGRSDVLWRQDNGTITDWLGQANGGFVGNAANASVNVSAVWQAEGVGDFNGDGRDDILWRHDNGTITDWLGQANGGFVGNAANASINVSNLLQIEGIGDFNGDGRDDILWRHDNGTVVNWLGQANGGFVDNSANTGIGVGAVWHIEGVGDFNGDGRDDILWRHDNGTITDWLGQANGGFVGNAANASINVSTAWQVQGVGDFNGDGRDDILWRNDNGTVVDWLGQANGGFVGNAANLNIDVSDALHVEAIGDYNGDGRDDILWRHDNGTVTDWLGQANGGFVDNAANFSVDVSDVWEIQSPDLM